ncbi:Ribosomal RNA small subunit methyltransferase I [Candidatus Hydrogenisulfobacillus filiaventi]|uniref:Ribosomal RNA small subunit methyltransferase I n=1 Tax=Candidatus Hydrogenisulfobacillus filiaventi TaxID=2707344 RepID=A0A6F8ZKC2_9FIRM|nr:Ribosomal RNA small subunit methyltransferase I [Candidatus Hydrogenisulfobacillus filiaventi]
MGRTPGTGEAGPPGVEGGRLYLIGTPLGNRWDLSARARAALEQVDLLLAEDTRVTARLLAAWGIGRGPVWSFHAHNWHRRLPDVLERLQAGASVGLVTDAGMPAVSDPGRELVEAAAGRGIPLTVVPGPTAESAAFAASGFPHPYRFWGFLPAKGPERRRALERLAAGTETEILYEAPHRVARTARDLAAVLGEAVPVYVGRELTKRHEEHWYGTLGELVRREDWRGEVVVVVGPRPAPAAAGPGRPDWAALLAAVRAEEAGGRSRRDSIRAVADRAGVSRRELYRRVQTGRPDDAAD